MAILACDIKTCMYQRVTLILKNEATVCTDVTFLLMRLSSIFFQNFGFVIFNSSDPVEQILTNRVSKNKQRHG